MSPSSFYAVFVVVNFARKSARSLTRYRMRRPTFIYGRLYLPVERHTASVEVLTPRTCAASLSSTCSGGFFGLKPSASAISSLMDAAIWVLIILFLSRCNSMRWSFAWEGLTKGWMKILKFGHGSSTQRAAPLSRRAGGGCCYLGILKSDCRNISTASLMDALGEVRLGKTNIKIWTKWLRGVCETDIPCSVHNSAIPAIKPM